MPSSEFRSYLVKGFCNVVLSLLALLVAMSIVGLSNLAFAVFLGFFPWVVRLAVAVACLITISGFADAVYPK
jgi:hypothetical protein